MLLSRKLCPWEEAWPPLAILVPSVEMLSGCFLQTNRNKIRFQSCQTKYNYGLFSEEDLVKFINAFQLVDLVSYVSTDRQQ